MKLIKPLVATFLVVSVSGCTAIPMVASGINGINKKGDQSSVITCKAFPEDVFRTASASNNGMVTTSEFGRSLAAVYSSNNVKVTLQTIKLAQEAKPAVIEKIATPATKKRGVKNSEPIVTEKIITPALDAVAGTYQIYGTSSNGVSRTWEFDDGIGNTTQKIVEALVASGCTLVETKREASMVESFVSK